MKSDNNGNAVQVRVSEEWWKKHLSQSKQKPFQNERVIFSK